MTLGILVNGVVISSVLVSGVVVSSVLGITYFFLVADSQLFNLDYALEFVTASPDCSAYREVLLVQKNQALWIPMAIGRKVK